MVELKGLTAQDRADWEKMFADQLAGHSEKEIDNAYVNYQFEQKHGDAGKGKSVADKIEYWNKDYDDSIQSMVNAPDTSNMLQMDTTQRSDETYIEAPTIEPIRMLGEKEEKETEDIFAQESPKFKENSEVFQQRFHYYDSMYERNAPAAKNSVNDIKEIAMKASNYYRKYAHTNYIRFDERDWLDIAKQFQAYQEAYGDEKAVEYLQKTIYNEVDRNTSWAEDQWNGIRGMGASAIQDIGILLTALPAGIIEYSAGMHEVPGASEWTKFIDAVVDNKATNYFNDVKQWGSIFPEEIEKAKAIGLSNTQIIDDYDVMTGEASLGELMFNKNTLAHLIDQYGFTAASLFMGGLANKATNALFKGYKGLRYAQVMKKTEDTSKAVRQTLDRIQKVQNFTNRTIIPGVIGEGEAVIEALQTKQTFMEEGKQAVDDRHVQEVEKVFQDLVANEYQSLFEELTKPKTFTASNGEQGYSGTFSGGGMSEEDAHKQIINYLWDKANASLEEQYQSSVDQLEYNAARAARGNFMINSAINGLINTTLKAPLFGNRTLGRIRTGKLQGFFSSKPKVQVDVNGKVTGKLPWWKAAYEVAQEPGGEGLEEMAQYASDKAFQGRGRNNLQTFLDCKYGAFPGQENVHVGQLFWEDYAAAAVAAGEAFADKEMWLSGFYGAASSLLGGVSRPGRAQLANGKEGKVWERGINAKGQQESTWDMVRRISPWRSGLSQGIERVKAINEDLKNQAEAMQAWLDNPENKAKFDGTNGTLRWAKAMQESSEAGDAFGYRNTSMGKAINDAIMLQKLKGTEFYNAFMQNVETARNLTMTSPEAQAYIDEFKANLGNDSENMSDEEIVEQIRDNANKMMKSYEDVQKQGDELTTMLGTISDDTKESLIYGKMMIDDFEERGKQIENDFKDLKINPIEVTPAKSEEGIEEDLKSEREILSMRPTERAQFLSEEAKHSTVQAKIIENLKAQALLQDGDFLGKVKDAAKLERAKQAYMQDYAKVLMDPDTFGQVYAANAKVAGMRAMYKKRYETLRDIKDYDTFAAQMDHLIAEGNVFERNTVLKQMDNDLQSSPDGANSNYARYKKDREDIADIVRRSTTEGDLLDLNGQATHHFINAVSYLVHKGINIHDRDEVTAALLENNDAGNLFFQYENEAAPYKSQEGEEVSTPTIEDVITLVHDVVDSYDREKAEQEWRKAPVEVTVDSQDASTTTPTPNSQNTENIDTPTEKTSDEGEGTVTKNTTITETGKTVEATREERTIVPKDSRVQSFVDVSGEKIIKAALRTEELIKSSKLTDEEKERALSILEQLGEIPYATVGEFVNTFNVEANRLDIESETSTADMMRKIAQRVAIQAQEESAIQQQEQQQDSDKLRELAARSPLARKLFGETPINLDSNNIQALVIDGEGGLKQRFSANPSDSNYSPILKYIEDNRIEEYLDTHELSRDVPVYFICDPVLAQEQREEWEKGGYKYTKRNLPLIACVKDKNGTVTINGENYQPIGIMPSTGSRGYMGANRLEKVRDYINETGNTPFLVADSKGVIETRLSNHVYAKAPEQLEQNISYLEAGLNTVTSEERTEWNNTPIEGRKDTSVYKWIKVQFLSRVEVRKGDRGKSLVVQIPTHKPNKEDRSKIATIPIDIFFPELSQTKGVTMKKTVGEMFLDGDTSVMSANSRLHRWGNELSKFARELDESGIVTLPDGTLAPESYKVLSEMSKALDERLQRFLYVPEYKVQIQAGDIVNGNRQFVITMTDGTNVITLGTIQKGTLTEAQQFELAKNLIYDNDNVRTGRSGKELVKWQVDYMGLTNGSEVAKDNLSKMFDDGIFEISKERIRYSISAITIAAPYTMEGAKVDFNTPQVANADNATSPNEAPVATNQVTTGGAVIDVNTGTVLVGETPVEQNVVIEEAKQKGKELEQDAFSQQSETTYTKYGQEHWNPYSNPGETAVTPESTIRNQAIEMFRQLVFNKSFGGMSAIRNLANMTEKAFKNFEAQIEAWRNKITAEGITLLPNEVLTTWHTEGQNIAMPVGIGYDTTGKWKVFVPVIGSSTEVDAQTAALLAQSIEKEYNIKISDFNIIELSVQMPKGNNITVDNAGQVITNKSHRYDGMRPAILGMKTIKAADITTYGNAVAKISSKIGTEVETPAVDESKPEQYNDGLFGGVQPVEDTDAEYIPKSQEWGVFAGKGLDAKKTVAALEAAGITEEEWILMSEPEREQELTCKGVYK